MSGFLYFAEGHKRPVVLEAAKQWGLAYAFETSIEYNTMDSFPGTKGPGVVFGESDRMKGKSIRCRWSEQVWARMPRRDDRPQLWLGYYKDATPTSESLKRSEVIAGHPMKMMDGGNWVVPFVRQYDGIRWVSLLPAYLVCNEQGKLVPGDPIDRYAPLYDTTAAIADALEGRNDGKVEDDDLYKAAVDLLKANYLVDAPEIGALRLFASTSMIAEMMLASCLCDKLDQWSEDVKKNESQADQNGTAASDGSADSPKTMPQPTPTTALSA